ncbi:MAG: phosphatase PAP2 family protein [Campylobacterota bacterium]|nr:phosphatase PAP2 family protein [Campylobacterota bacterium]
MKKVSSIIIFLLLCSNTIFAFELDKKVTLDEDGFWGAHYDIPKYATIGILAAAAYEGTESRFGKTAWKSLDAGLMSQLLAEGSKRITGRLRPRHTDSPSEWFEDGKSFFSGHVSGMTALVTPFVLEYKDDSPWVHLLWALPLHQMGGRVKAQAHWQSDVIVGALVGFASGYWAHERESPLILYFDGDKVVMGLKHRF